MIDLHSHILPELDDGQDLSEALSMANIAVKEDRCRCGNAHCLKANDMMGLCRGRAPAAAASACTDARDGPDVFYGTELLMDPIFSSRRLGQADHKRYPLYPCRTTYGEMCLFADDFVYKLQLAGLIPVIAHPERNLRIINDPNKLYRFV